MSAATYYEPYKLPAGILALAVHAAFFLLLYFGFSWQTQPAATMSVELWQSLPGAAAGSPDRREIEMAEPQQTKETVKPEIVLPDKLKDKPVQTMSEKTKQPVTASAATSGEMGTGITGQAAGVNAGRDAAIGRVVDEYTGKIIDKIRRNIVMPPDVTDNVRAEYLVTLLPGGAVLGARLIKSSGNAAYDTAVERAILKSQPLPLPANVAMFNKFRELKLVFKPTE